MGSDNNLKKENEELQKKIDDLTLQTKEQETQIYKLNTLKEEKEKK